eukprot:gene3262-3774_t
MTRFYALHGYSLKLGIFTGEILTEPLHSELGRLCHHVSKSEQVFRHVVTDYKAALLSLDHERETTARLRGELVEEAEHRLHAQVEASLCSRVDGLIATARSRNYNSPRRGSKQAPTQPGRPIGSQHSSALPTRTEQLIRQQQQLSTGGLVASMNKLQAASRGLFASWDSLLTACSSAASAAAAGHGSASGGGGAPGEDSPAEHRRGGWAIQSLLSGTASSAFELLMLQMPAAQTCLGGLPLPANPGESRVQDAMVDGACNALDALADMLQALTSHPPSFIYVCACHGPNQEAEAMAQAVLTDPDHAPAASVFTVWHTLRSLLAMWKTLQPVVLQAIASEDSTRVYTDSMMPQGPPRTPAGECQDTTTPSPDLSRYRWLPPEHSPISSAASILSVLEKDLLPQLDVLFESLQASPSDPDRLMSFVSIWRCAWSICVAKTMNVPSVFAGGSGSE